MSARDPLYDEDGVEGPFNAAMERAMADDAEDRAFDRQRAIERSGPPPCGDCEDYAGERTCGTCGRFLCHACHEPIDGTPLFALGDEEHLPEDKRPPYCSTDCIANEAERQNEALHGERR